MSDLKYLVYAGALGFGYFAGKKYLDYKNKNKLNQSKIETKLIEPAKTDSLKVEPEKDFDNWKINICKDKCVTDEEVMGAFLAKKPIFINLEIEGTFLKTDAGGKKGGTYKSVIKTLPLDMPEKDGKKYLRSIVYTESLSGNGPKKGQELIFAINQIHSIDSITNAKEIEEVTDYIVSLIEYSGSAESDLDLSKDLETV